MSDQYPWGETPRAPKRANRGSSNGMKAPDLARELAITSLVLCLLGEFIDEPTIKAHNATLKERYPVRPNTIPTYLGQGRSNDGLGLWAKDKLITPSRDNARLCVQHLIGIGYTMQEVADTTDLTVEELIAAVDGLKTHEEFEKRVVNLKVNNPRITNRALSRAIGESPQDSE